MITGNNARHDWTQIASSNHVSSPPKSRIEGDVENSQLLTFERLRLLSAENNQIRQSTQTSGVCRAYMRVCVIISCDCLPCLSCARLNDNKVECTSTGFVWSIKFSIIDSVILSQMKLFWRINFNGKSVANRNRAFVWKNMLLNLIGDALKRAHEFMVNELL